MLSKGLFLPLMFIFTTSVTSEEIKDKQDRQGKVEEPRYLLNHPPSAEYNNPTLEVVSEEDSTKKQVRKGKVVEPKYPYNHPPSSEYYNPIPVAIVYEDDNSFTGRSEDRTTMKKSDDEKNARTIIVSAEENEQTTKKEQDVTTATAIVNNIEIKTEVKLGPKPRILNNLQIPVTIVYESDSNSYQSHQRTKTDTKTQTSRRSSNYNRKLQNKGVTEVPKNLTSQVPNVGTEKPQTNTEGRTFKKRTEGRSPVVPILESENYVFSHNGNFHYRYEGGDGTKAYSEGKLKSVDDGKGESVVGGFSYTDKDGNDFSLSYTADENGYRPVGAHLPTPPPIPPAIARALAYLAAATPEPVTKRPVKSKLSR